MARIFPEHREPKFDSEIRVLAELRRLDDDWHVFHGIRWQALRRDRQSDGETDFALFHPTKGILVIEAKGGEPLLKDGDWFRRHPNGRVERLDDPFEQASDCRRQMADYLTAHVDGLGTGARVGYAVAFPHVRIDSGFGPAAPREVILDASELVSIEQSIARLVSHWAPPQHLSEKQLGQIRASLLPSVEVRRLLRDEIDETSRELFRVTEEQYRVLTGLRGKRQALIYGGAGTGKTVLAIEQARRLSVDLAARVLLVCYNHLLGEDLRRTFRRNELVTTGTFHQVARDLAVNARVLIPEDPPKDYWDVELPNVFPDLADDAGFEIDAVIVDEAQDFRPAWWDSLRLVMRDPEDGWFYVFADPNQTLFTLGWEPPLSEVSWTLDVNCRNTIPIAERVAAVYRTAHESLGVRGPRPVFHEVSSEDRAVRAVLKELSALLRESVDASDIRVLTSSREMADRFHGMDVEGVGLVRHGEDGIGVETVGRFKGLEAEAVLLVLHEISTDLERSIAYTGMSRARTLLHVFGPTSAKEAIGWGPG